MEHSPIKYTDGWKYVLAEEYKIFTNIFPPKKINHKNDFTLYPNGDLIIYKGYPWDGASGGIDTKNAMVASLVHDCFCEMMRTGELEYDYYSEQVHNLLGELARTDGMLSFRAKLWVLATKLFQGGHPSHPDEHPIMEAP